MSPKANKHENRKLKAARPLTVLGASERQKTLGASGAAADLDLASRLAAELHGVFVLAVCPACAVKIVGVTFRPAELCTVCALRLGVALRIMLNGEPVRAIVRCPTCHGPAGFVVTDKDGVTWNCPEGCNP